jgi:hypothetical protein
MAPARMRNLRNTEFISQPEYDLFWFPDLMLMFTLPSCMYKVRFFIILNIVMASTYFPGVWRLILMMYVTVLTCLAVSYIDLSEIFIEFSDYVSNSKWEFIDRQDILNVPCQHFAVWVFWLPWDWDVLSPALLTLSESPGVILSSNLNVLW